MLRPSCAGSGELPQSKQGSKYDSPEMESSLVCLRTRKPAWVGGAGRTEAQLSCQSAAGSRMALWATVRTMDFILRAAFGCFGAGK